MGEVGEVGEVGESVERVVAAQHARWGTSAVDADVFGTGDPAEIAATIDRFCLDELGADVEEGLFYGASAGCVLGVRLRGGGEVVIKAYQQRWQAPYLRAVQSVQTHVVGRGLPCATPLRGPTALVPGRPHQAMVESVLADPGLRPFSTAAERRVSAAGLARMIAVCRELPASPELGDHPLRRRSDGLYGEPHSPLFDFAGTAEGAAWIDEHARRALLQREADERPPVVAHADWSARNVRLDDHRLLAVYDWDSVALVPESTAVGQAAATWSVTADPGGTEFPSLPDIVGFMTDYEKAAGHGLDDAQWRAAGAAAAYTLAYTARCEHALAMTERARPDQHAAQDRLADAGSALLDLGRLRGRLRGRPWGRGREG
jgi:Phosphotransferase enzyme family